MRVSCDPSYRVQNKDLFVSLDTISECSGNSFSVAGKLVSQLHCCWKELLLMNLMNLCSRELLSLESYCIVALGCIFTRTCSLLSALEGNLNWFK